MFKYEKMSRDILNEVETSHHLILIRLYFILTILITGLLQLLNAATVSTVCYIFVHFIIGYEKKQLSCNC
jgi:hypothetical protein